MPSCHTVGKVGKVVAMLCAAHCATFVVLFAVVALQMLPVSSEFLWWFDNLWIHLIAAALALILGSLHLLLHRESVGGRAVALFSTGGLLFVGSILWESQLHRHAELEHPGEGVARAEQASELDQKHEHLHSEKSGHAHHHDHAEDQGNTEGETQDHHEAHLHSPAPHLMFMAGNLCLLLLHTGVPKRRRRPIQ